MTRTTMAVALGGALGAVLRFALASFVGARSSAHAHLGTLLVNLIGCLVIGYLYGLFEARFIVSDTVRAGVIVGIIGGFTTFSSFSLDVLRLLERGEALVAVSYVALSVFGGLLCTWLGLLLGRG